MRVIAGALGGRRLVAPKGHQTRPTTDRVREALFSVLGDVTQASVLDLYAGTGALGIEALSRGARRAVFVESGRHALAALRRNLDTLGLGSNTRVLACPAARAPTDLRDEDPFDLVLLDPPYELVTDAVDIVRDLERLGLLAAETCVVLEHASRDKAPTLPQFSAPQTRKYGDTSVSIYRRA